MNDSSIYSTGWYSLSPIFASWYTHVHRVDTLQKCKETKRVAMETRKKEITNARKIAEGTISIYA
jgi:hypothetical protein